MLLRHCYAQPANTATRRSLRQLWIVSISTAGEPTLPFPGELVGAQSACEVAVRTVHFNDRLGRLERDLGRGAAREPEIEIPRSSVTVGGESDFEPILAWSGLAIL